MEWPKVSPAFTIEDIRLVKDYFDYVYTNMSEEELQAYIREVTQPIQNMIDDARRRQLGKNPL